ncbi:hypothetical protein GA0115240_142136 [Streptomyces sp. DvalAA-14]|uniref:hypothetical protein n=1 Tax=unclassified Streptomyces TaxID=2593676 RepID=UPI00081B87F1|nr:MULTISPECIES: hypothetical protein [unclassified Streptomyces]MYS22483.1 hypothetical protein [Streptomyces sp. SID4948]SCE17091.1 hypothetical protein GA0115240_142136 [Streptomyces sp. DvalAA-14]
MSVTGFWIVGVLPDADVARVRRVFPGHTPGTPTAAPWPGRLDWWYGRSAAETFFEPTPHGPRPTDDALRWQECVDVMRPVDESAEEVRDELMALVPQQEGAGLFCAAARKGDPFAPLGYALGPERMLRLPGACGEFLLDASEVRAALPAAEAALDLSRESRSTVIDRVRDWTTAMADASGHNADDLIDGPLRVLRHAGQQGLGAVGMTRWY